MPSWKLPALLAGAAVAGTAILGGRRWRRHRATQEALGRWAVVTVLHPRTEVVDSAPYRRLQALAPEVELELREAPGNRGTEVAARRPPGRRPGGSRDDLRLRLREVKQELEAGEVLHATPRPQGPRPPTPGGVVIDFVDRRAQGKGVL